VTRSGTSGAEGETVLGRLREHLASGDRATSERRATPDGLAQTVRQVRPGIGLGAALAVGSAARAEILGAGPLQNLLEQPSVTDVLVNGPRGVWVDRGRGLEAAGVPALDEPAVRALATRLAAAAGQRLDDASPIADGRLPDGTRLHAVLPPLSPEGTLISLRTLRRRALSVAELVSGGTVGTAGAEILRALVECRANVLVSGATGAGKTTLLAAMLSLVPHHERIVCIEEASELRPAHPHVVHLQTRQANVQAAGAVDLAGLVRAALRMRPDRIVLGEARGAEIREVLAALNTGHPGSWFTLHANSSADVPARLAGLGALAALDERAVAVQAAAALDAVVLLRRAGGTRVVAEVGELVASDGRVRVDVVLHGGQPTGEWAGFAARWLS